MRRILLATLAAVLTVQQAASEPISSWIEPMDLSEAVADGAEFVEDGVEHILFDRQVLLEPAGYQTNIRRVVRIANTSGLEAEGAIKIEYDPQEAELVVHDVWRTRNGVRTRVTGLDFADLRRERGIESGIIDGTLTRYAHLPDLRVGDVLDLSWTVQTSPAVFLDFYETRRTAEPSGYRIDRLRILSDPGREIVVNGPAKLSVRPVGDMVERVWLHRDTAPFEPDGTWRDWDAVYGVTQIATASTWAGVVDDIADAYRPMPLPADLAARVRAFKGTTSERVTDAFRLVQSEIRYLGVEIGEGGYIPRAPDLVWSRRFGDCKDKSLLLVSILAEIGINAEVVLVHSQRGDRLPGLAPTPYAFDHAVVRILGDGAPYFLDPTDRLQGGIGRAIDIGDFEWALPLTPGTDGLVPVVQPQSEAPTHDVVSRFEFQDDGDFAAILTEVTIFRGAEADSQRDRLQRDGMEDRAEDYLDWYRDRYSGTIALSDLQVEDDFDANVLTIREQYGIPEEGIADRRDRFWMNPYATADELEELPDPPFEAFPLDPLDSRHRVEFVGYPHLIAPTDLVMENAFFDYTRSAYDVPGGVGADCRLRLKIDEIGDGQADAYADARDAQDSESDWQYNLPRSGHLLGRPMAMGVSVRDWMTILALVTVVLTAAAGIRRGYGRAA